MKKIGMGLFFLLLFSWSATSYADLQGKWKTTTTALLEESWGNHRQYDCDLTLSVDLRSDSFAYIKDLNCKGDAPHHTTFKIDRRGNDLFFKGENVGFVSDSEVKFDFYDKSTPHFPIGRLFDLALSAKKQLYIDDMFVFGQSGNYTRLRGQLARYSGGVGETELAASEGFDLFPSSVGQKWVYQVQKFGPYYPCKTGLEVSEITQELEVDGQRAFESSYCGTTGYFRKLDGQVLSYFQAERSWILELDLPEHGRRWWEFRSYSRWEKLDTYTVPAGTFQGCYKKVREVGYTHFLVYCNGVGLVHERVVDMAGNGWNRELFSRSF